MSLAMRSFLSRQGTGRGLCPGGLLVLSLALLGCHSGSDSNPGTAPGPELTAPSITTQPADQAVAVGQTATFSVVATGTAPLVYHWERNGTPVAGAASSTYTTPATLLADGGTTFRVTVSNGVQPSAVSRSATLTVNGGGGTLLTPRIFPNALVNAARKASTGSTQEKAQWSRLLAKLDAGLNVVVPSEGIYQASELEAIPDYALGYRVLKTSDKARAEKYADKAIGLIKSALHDYQKGTWIARQYLARGDGAKLTFTLADADFDPSTLEVSIGAVTTTPVVKGAAAGQDDTGQAYAVMLKVSKSSDGPADFAKDVDWRHDGDWSEAAIDWSLNSANQPSPGQTYYVTSTSPYGSQVLSYDSGNPGDTSQDLSVGGHTLTIHAGSGHTLSAAPSAAQALFVQYSYGTHASDYSTLAYQQTSMGDGGFNSAFIDTGYTSRYLGKDVAIGYDWLYDYPGFSAALKGEVQTLLGKWYNYYRNHGYYYESPSSNYGAGEYFSNFLTMLALQGRASFTLTDGSAANQFDGVTVLDPGTSQPLTAQADMLAARTQNLLPILTGSITATQGIGSLKGGFWAEGWNYGQMAARSLMLAGLALEEAMLIPQATQERAWAGEALLSLIHSQPDAATIYDGGDWYAYPAPFVGKDLVEVLTTTCTDPTLKAYGNRILQHYPDTPSADWLNLLFNDPGASVADWTPALPTAYLAAGTGLVTARADWSYQSTWLALQLGNLVRADHQTQSPGLLQLSRGADQLLINGNAPNEQQYPKCYSNTVMIDDGGAGETTYRFNTGDWYFSGSDAFDSGNPASLTSQGCSLHHFEGALDHVYIAGDYRSAFFRAGSASNPASELTRQVLYLRPDYVVVHDRVGTTHASYPKLLRWHTISQPSVSAPSSSAADGSGAIWNGPVSYSLTSGGSRLFGLTYATAQGAGGILPLILPAASSFAKLAPLNHGDTDPCPLASCDDATLLASHTPTAASLQVQNPTDAVPVYALILGNDFTSASAPSRVRYTSVFESAPAATAAMHTCVPLFSADSSLEGARIGDWIALFGKDGPVPAGFSYSTGVASAALHHVIVDLAPGTSYTIAVDSGT